PHKGRKPCANKRLHGRRAPEEHAVSHDLKLPRRPKAVPAGAGSTRTEPGRWTVSTRAIGEVLTTEIRCDDLRLLLFASPEDESARRIEASLEALTASGADRDAAAAGVVPAPLARAVEVLTGLVGDLSRGPRRRAGAVAFYQSGREVACACIGGGDPDVWTAGQPFEAPWIELMPANAEDDGGPRARGFSLFVKPNLDMRIRWPYLLGTPRPEGALVDARWSAPHGFHVTVHALDTEADAGDEPAVRTGAFFDGWFSDLGAESASDPARHAPVDPADEQAEFDAASADAAIPRATAGPVREAATAFPDLVAELRAEAELHSEAGLHGVDDVVPAVAAIDPDAATPPWSAVTAAAVPPPIASAA